MNYASEYQRWRSNSFFDRETQAELQKLYDEKEIEDRFYRELTFGTGGLRGLIGAGTNRINYYTVGKATQGLCDYILAHEKERSAVIAYDSRNMSEELALNSACIFAANGIHAYLFESLRPTPELSFAVRKWHTAAGIVITASHNPACYNGYKVYLSDGGQLVPPYDRMIIETVNAVGDYSNIKRISVQNAIRQELLTYIGSETDEAYYAALKSLVLSLEALKACAGEIKIVFTPLHGAGNIPVRRILSDLGFSQVWTVAEQENPNGDFPTVSAPNPENPSVFRHALDLAKEKNADIVLATDCDGDRLGVYLKDGNDGYRRLNGNMSGLLIAEYELSRKKELGLFPKNTKDGALVTTIVSSKMARAMAERYGITLFETLTGFKYVGEYIRKFEDSKKCGGSSASEGAYEFLFGFEESYGCLFGTYARDKDAVAAAMALCEAAAYYRLQGRTLWEQMLSLYETYGYYAEDLIDKTYNGAEGGRRITEIMERLRNSEDFMHGEATVRRDYKSGIVYDFANGEKTETGLPYSDVIFYELKDGGWVCARPSGTEPKIKLYFGVKGISFADAEARLLRLRERLSRLFEE